MKNNIELKSIGTLIDELITTDIKCWFAQETVMNETDVIKVSEAAKQAQLTNARRNKLIRAIDERLGDNSITNLSKSYG